MPARQPIVGVYVIRNVVTGQIYVGSSNDVRRRWNEHRRELRTGHHKNKKLVRSWRQHGDAAHAFEIVEVLVNVDALDAREGFWINELRAFEDGFNLIGFSEGRPFWNEDQRRERSRKATERWAANPLTPEQRLRRSESAKRRIVNHPGTGFSPGRQPSEKERALIAELHRGKPLSIEHRKKLSVAQNRRFAACPVSEETAQRISEGLKRAWADGRMKGQTGKTVSPEVRLAIAEANRGQKRSPAIIQKLRAAQRKRFAEQPVSAETKLKQSETALRRWKARSENERRAFIERRAAAQRGKPRRRKKHRPKDHPEFDF